MGIQTTSHPPTSRIRFGVLGASRIAQKAAIPAIIEVAELALIGSRSSERGKALAEQYGSQLGSHDDVVHSDVDAIYISLPNSLHEEWAIKALEAGKHVWCEKPAALSFASAKRMVDAARKNNVRLREGFMFLYHPQHAQVRELITGGALGELMSFEGKYMYPMPAKGDIRLDATLGGGIYVDAGVYPIRASRMIFGREPESVKCSLTVDQALGVDTKVDMVLTYAGKAARIASGFDDNYVSTYHVSGSKGHIDMERAYAVPKDRAVKIFLTMHDDAKEIVVPPADHFRLMLEEFCKEIALGMNSMKKYEDDLLAQARVVEAGRRSHTEKRTVDLTEIT